MTNPPKTENAAGKQRSRRRKNQSAHSNEYSFSMPANGKRIFDRPQAKGFSLRLSFLKKEKAHFPVPYMVTISRPSSAEISVASLWIMLAEISSLRREVMSE